MNLPCDTWPVPCTDNPPCWNCGIYAAVQDVESAWYLAGNPLVNLSIRHVTDCAPAMAKAPLKHPDNCGGGSRYHFWDWMINNTGVATEASYPLTSEPQPTLGAPVPCRADLATSVEAKVTSWFRVSMAEDDPVDAEAKLLDALRKVGPVSVCITSSHLHRYYGGVDDPGQPNSTTGTDPCVPAWEHECDHAVNVVGYGYDVASGKDYWKLRNEWGTDWGEGGYYRLARGHNHCGVASYAYHATVEPKARFHCHAASQRCVAAFSDHSTLETCEAACAPKTRYHCDTTSSQCILAISGHSTEKKCEAACTPGGGGGDLPPDASASQDAHQVSTAAIVAGSAGGVLCAAGLMLSVRRSWAQRAESEPLMQDIAVKRVSFNVGPEDAPPGTGGEAGVCGDAGGEGGA